MTISIFKIFDLLRKLTFRKLNIEHAKSGLNALQTAEKVFVNSRALGGKYSYPWFDGKTKIDSNLLFHELVAIENRSRDRKTIRDISRIRDLLEMIHENSLTGPDVAYPGSIKIDAAQTAIDNQRAKKQLLACDEGLPLVAKAMNRIHKLESRL